MNAGRYWDAHIFDVPLARLPTEVACRERTVLAETSGRQLQFRMEPRSRRQAHEQIEAELTDLAMLEVRHTRLRDA